MLSRRIYTGDEFLEAEFTAVERLVSDQSDAATKTLVASMDQVREAGHGPVETIREAAKIALAPEHFFAHAQYVRAYFHKLLRYLPSGDSVLEDRVEKAWLHHWTQFLRKHYQEAFNTVLVQAAPKDSLNAGRWGLNLDTSMQEQVFIAANQLGKFQLARVNPWHGTIKPVKEYDSPMKEWGIVSTLVYADGDRAFRVHMAPPDRALRRGLETIGHQLGASYMRPPKPNELKIIMREGEIPSVSDTPDNLFVGLHIPGIAGYDAYGHHRAHISDWGEYAWADKLGPDSGRELIPTLVASLAHAHERSVAYGQTTLQHMLLVHPYLAIPTGPNMVYSNDLNTPKKQAYDLLHLIVSLASSALLESASSEEGIAEIVERVLACYPHEDVLTHLSSIAAKKDSWLAQESFDMFTQYQVGGPYTVWSTVKKVLPQLIEERLRDTEK